MFTYNHNYSYFHYSTAINFFLITQFLFVKNNDHLMVQLFGIKYSFLTLIICTVVWFQLFLSNTNNLYTIIVRVFANGSGN